MPAAAAPRPLDYGDQHDTAGEFAAARKRFADVFGPGGTATIVRSPGRVNLIGEHVDYNDGFVLPMAIEPHVLVVCRPRADGLVRAATTMYSNVVAEFSLAALGDELAEIRRSVAAGDDRPPPCWYDYSKGMAAMLARDATNGGALAGMDVLLSSTIPAGGGLSSSAALEVGTGLALLAVAGRSADGQAAQMALAKDGKAAENDFVGMPCGLMDQAIVAMGKAGHAMLLDCRTEQVRFIRVDPAKVKVVIVNSMVKHALVDGGYAQRRATCEAAVAVLQKKYPGRTITALRDVTQADVDGAKAELVELSKHEPYRNVFACLAHVIGEIDRTPRAAELLDKGEYAAFGRLMQDSHWSLSRDYEVSTGNWTTWSSEP